MDSVNWEQLVVQYVKNDKPIERLLEYVHCPNICGATRTDLTITAVNEVGAKYQEMQGPHL